MPPRPRLLTEHDRAAWQAYARHVRALPGKPAFGPPEAPPSAPAVTQPDAASATATRPAAAQPKAAAPGLPAIVTGLPPPGLDRASWNRLRAGKLVPARTLDLHGRTANAAFQALERFLHAAAADQLRCVEIITGRGSGETGGVIRRELPFWLNLPALRPMILATVHPHPTNPGAVRVLLRRPGKASRPR